MGSHGVTIAWPAPIRTPSAEHLINGLHLAGVDGRLAIEAKIARTTDASLDAGSRAPQKP
jgi:hypothetical protein